MANFTMDNQYLTSEHSNVSGFITTETLSTESEIVNTGLNIKDLVTSVVTADPANVTSNQFYASTSNDNTMSSESPKIIETGTNWIEEMTSSDLLTETTSGDWITKATSSDWITEASGVIHTTDSTSFYDSSSLLSWISNETNITQPSTLWIGESTTTNDTMVPSFTESTPIFISSGPLLLKLNHEIFMKHLLPSLIYVSILMVMGIPGNILILYVYGNRWSKTTSRVFILALAAFDLFNCICSISVEIALLARFFLFNVPSVCKVSRFITCVLNHGSTFVLVIIAFDRFRRIYQPLRVPFNPKMAKKIIIGSVVFGIVTGWPALLLYGTYSVPMKIPYSNFIVIGKTCLIDDDLTLTIYPLMWILFLLLSHFAVDITLIVLYTCVGRAVFKRRTKLKTLKGSYKKADVSTTYDSNETIEILDVPPPKKKQMSKMSFVFLKENSSVKMHSRHGSQSGEGRQSSRIKDLAKPLEKKLKTRNVRAGRTTVMLFLVTVVFIVSYIPHTGVVISRSLYGKKFYTDLTDIGKVVYQLLLRSYFLNCVLNPIVYCFVNKQFRKECKKVFVQIFCCRREKNFEGGD